MNLPLSAPALDPRSAVRELRGRGRLAGALVAGVLTIAAAVRWPALVELLAIFAICFAPAERALPAQRRARRAGIGTDIAHFLVTSEIRAAAVAAVVGLLAVVHTQGLLQPLIAPLPPAAAGAVAILCAELGAYWVHRAQHHVGWLWRFHSIHHSSEQVDWLSTVRSHPVDAAVLQLARLLPLSLLGAPAQLLVIYAGVQTVSDTWAHSNLRLPLFGLRYVVMTPLFHRWHHATDDFALNHNFAGMLPVLDLIFGTAIAPRGVEPSGLGLLEPIDPTYVGQMLHPLRPRRDPGRRAA